MHSFYLFDTYLFADAFVASSSNVEDVALGTANHSVVNDYDVEEPLRDVARTESISEEQLP